MKKVIILYTNAGSGHKAAALALQETITKATDWEVQLVNPLTEWCSEYDLVRKFTSSSADDFYNKNVSIKRQPLFSLLAISVLFFLNLVVNKRKIINRFIEKWAYYKPDLVISVTPFINEIVVNSLEPLINIPFITLITDYKECYPRVWIVSKRQYVLCCSEAIAQQALNRGIPTNKICTLSGMLVGSNFYFVNNLNRISLRSLLGLNPDLTTGLVIFGGYGNPDMIDIAKKLNRFEQALQMIFVCGNNEDLYKKLNSIKVNYNIIVLRFIDNVEQYLHCADFVIGKPGGLSVAEAAIMHVPQIVKLNGMSLLQERYNAQWVKEKQIGVVVRSVDNINAVIKSVLDKSEYFKTNLKKIHNKALFEIPVILERIMRESNSE